MNVSTFAVNKCKEAFLHQRKTKITKVRYIVVPTFTGHIIRPPY